MIDLHQLPAWPQSQQLLAEQMTALVQVANRLGLYDAADAVRQLTPRLHQVKYGCHVDVEPGQQPDGCVIDEGRLHDCIYAKPGMRKEQCEYWRTVKPLPATTDPLEPKDPSHHAPAPEPLSPAAQAVMDAYGHEVGGTAAITSYERRGIAAALRDVADQVVPTEPDYMRDAIPDAYDQREETRRKILAIAAQLEGRHG